MKSDSPRRSRARWWPAVAAATLIAVIGAVWVLRRDAALTFSVAGGAQPASVGRWYEAANAQIPFTFSDGTTVLIHRGGRGRVDRLAVGGGRVRLDQGRASVSVVRQAASDWRFSAGPFDVHVTGTRFDLEWTPPKRRLTLVMHDGSVRVEGPTLGTGRRSSPASGSSSNSTVMRRCRAQREWLLLPPAARSRRPLRVPRQQRLCRNGRGAPLGERPAATDLARARSAGRVPRGHRGSTARRYRLGHRQSVRSGAESAWRRGAVLRSLRAGAPRVPGNAPTCPRDFECRAGRLRARTAGGVGARLGGFSDI